MVNMLVRNHDGFQFVRIFARDLHALERLTAGKPASTRMLAVELERTVQFPLLPLAKTVMRTAIECQHNGNLALGKYKNGFPREAASAPASL